MAILLHEKRVLILEPPKTGTTWLRRALGVVNVPHQILDCAVACPRHSAAECYDEWKRDPSMTVVCPVRHPLGWIESFWRFHRGIMLRSGRPDRPVFKKGLYYGHKHFFPCHDDFGMWVQTLQPGQVTDYFAWFTKPATKILYQERLEDDLSGLLCGLGYDAPATRLRHVGLMNVSRPYPCDWPEGRREQFLNNEMGMIREFYHGDRGVPERAVI